MFVFKTYNIDRAVLREYNLSAFGQEKENGMNILYAKTVLYLYAGTEKLVRQIDELVERKALASANDFSPAVNQCAAIAELTRCKAALLYLKEVCERILPRFSERELIYLDYKYFKKRDRSEYAGMDFCSRTYFRRQIRLAEKFAEALSNDGIDDGVFCEEYLSCRFIKRLYGRVREKEKEARKNKSAAEKAAARRLETVLPADKKSGGESVYKVFTAADAAAVKGEGDLESQKIG